MIIGIDGTGPDSNREYAHEMANSFVHVLIRRLATSRNKEYFRGPTLTGEVMGVWVSNAVELINRWRTSDHSPVFLAGYSRGGAAAIEAARWLATRGIPVGAMFLFDAVDRSNLSNVESIPRNVEHAYHATRTGNTSRWYFGNCGIRSDRPGALERRGFFGTHAALGGIPWTGDHPDGVSRSSDFACSREVWHWMSSKLRRHGVIS